MSERSLLLPNKLLSPKRRAAVAGGIALAAALTAGCENGPKDPTLIGDGKPNCADSQLALPQINVPASQKPEAQRRLLVAERRLCGTILEVGPDVLELYRNRGRHNNKRQFDVGAASTGKGASKYDVEIKEVIKKSGDEVSFTVNTSEVNSDNKKLSINYPKEVRVKSGYSDASISFESTGRWSMDAHASVRDQGKWPDVDDYGLVTNMHEVAQYEKLTNDVQRAIFDVAGPVMD